jgi:diguanylate cyclase (GGDEF)-like protein
MPKPDIASVLLRLTQQLSQGHSLEVTLQAVTDAALELLPADHASVRLLDGARTHLLATARSGAGTEHRSVAMKPGEGIAGWVFTMGAPARVDDARNDPRFVSRVPQGFTIGSMLAEPLLSNGKAIGVLSVSSSHVGAFTNEHEILARLLANCSVPAIERARIDRLDLICELTLAFNARYLVPRLHEEIERAKSSSEPLGIVAVDVENLKAVNDGYGRDCGDRILSQLAERVRQVVRPLDVLVRGREDELFLILPKTGLEDAQRVAREIDEAVKREPFEMMPGARVTQGVHIASLAWDGATNADALVHRVEEALAQEGGSKPAAKSTRKSRRSR